MYVQDRALSSNAAALSYTLLGRKHADHDDDEIGKWEMDNSDYSVRQTRRYDSIELRVTKEAE